jgi:uncharacterized protein (TIGR00290 family)
MQSHHFMSWSGGKDSAFCLYKANQQGIGAGMLLTTINKIHNRISMHGVRKELLEKQATSLQLPLRMVELSEQPDMKEYEHQMSTAFQQLKKEGYTHGLFGDIFLEDLKQYRQVQLKNEGLEPVFPIWKMNSHELIKEFIALGFKAIIVCINSMLLDKSFCGRLIDESLLNDLPSAVDVCGENGEYHSFVFDGPLFSKPIPFTRGEMVYRQYIAPSNGGDECFSESSPSMGFYFCDLIPG